MILAVTKVTAQDTFVVFENSTHVHTVNKNGDNLYKWSIYYLTDLSATITDNSIFEIVKDENNQVSIKWKQVGNYVLAVEESDGACQNLKAIKVNVIANTLQIAFDQSSSSDCYDGNDVTPIPIKLQVDATNALPDSKYDVTVNYTVLFEGSEVNTETKTFTYEDVGEDGEVDLSVNGIEEELDKTKEYTIRINWAKDGFNTPFNIVSGKGTHTRTIYQLPQTGTMVQQ